MQVDDSGGGFQSQAPSPTSPPHGFKQAERNLSAADRCLAAAAYSLNFDICEIWTFVPDPAVKASCDGPCLEQPNFYECYREL